ncbi:MAG TPA: ATP-binding cassette domain-containing protein [Myxococcales bacterium]|nr:ATP-binding cassette domain-containing protein [Myxococcales bacterium]HIN85116.1 ATP-binding cassette domain-containing protein [Myxococcales bacterium]
MIEFRNISKAFGHKTVLRDVSLTVERGKIVFIIGTSGAGKSVLIKLLVGLLRPDSGEIFLDGQEVTTLSEQDLYPIRKRCAMVFQHSTLFDSMTLQENVALPLRKHKDLTHLEAMEEATRMLKKVDMHEEARRYPADIGDGLRKRVAIARALTLDPEYVIFDEPTTGLDPLAAANVDRLIKELAERSGVTSIVVSHDLRSIFTVADRIAMLYKGKVLLDGSPDDFRNSPDLVVQQFIAGEAEGPMEFPRLGE